MNIWILSATIAATFVSISRADEHIYQNNLINPRESYTEAPIDPRLPSYGTITANDQPDYHPDQQGHKETPDETLRFNDDPIERGYVNMDKYDSNNDLTNNSFDDVESRQYIRILTTADRNDKFLGNPVDKINYKGNVPEIFDESNRKFDDVEKSRQYIRILTTVDRNDKFLVNPVDKINYKGNVPEIFDELRPHRKPKSLTQRAVSAVAEALTSIAKYDDHQCVPKLLCEVASGRAASSSTLLKATAGLQPLLQLLESQNGLNSSPLLLFGRVAVLGVKAKGDSAVCTQAYPRCPNDPEILIKYLNTHNGGFFRFFGQPGASQKPHNLEQFYNYLSGQNGYKQQQQNYRISNHGKQAQSPNGARYYDEQNSFSSIKDIDSEIEERIQNKPGVNILEDVNEQIPIEEDGGSKWSFPEESNSKKRNEKIRGDGDRIIREQPERLRRGSKTLKFPDERSDDKREIYKPKGYVRKQKKLFFPGEINQQIRPIYQTTAQVNTDNYVFDQKHQFYVNKPKDDPNVRVVYVVRGNGDPNHPEVVRLRPGQSL